MEGSAKRTRRARRLAAACPPPGPVAAAPALTVALAARQRLEVLTRDDRSELALVGSDGKVRLRIEVTAEGPVLHVEGDGLKVRVEGDLALTADRLALVGRQELTLRSGGDLHVEAARDLHSQARIQHIKAELGNVNVRANDDVRLNGERVMVNC